MLTGTCRPARSRISVGLVCRGCSARQAAASRARREAQRRSSLSSMWAGRSFMMASSCGEARDRTKTFGLAAWRMAWSSIQRL